MQEQNHVINVNDLIVLKYKCYVLKKYSFEEKFLNHKTITMHDYIIIPAQSICFILNINDVYTEMFLLNNNKLNNIPILIFNNTLEKCLYLILNHT